MNDPLVMTMCLEALFGGGDPDFREGGARVLGRALKALIVASEITPRGEKVYVVAGSDNG